MTPMPDPQPSVPSSTDDQQIPSETSTSATPKTTTDLPGDVDTTPPVIIVKERRGKAWWSRFSVACGSLAVVIAVVSSFQNSNNANQRADEAAAILADTRLETTCRAGRQIELEIARAELNQAEAELDKARVDYDVVFNELLIALTGANRTEDDINQIRDEFQVAINEEIARGDDVTDAAERVTVAAEARRTSVEDCVVVDGEVVSQVPTTVGSSTTNSES